MKPAYYEFFAGAGMARAGLGDGWRCLFANDSDRKKAACYAANFGAREFVCADVATLGAADLPGAADLAWASFPCQDLSLAGAGAGLDGARSGTFWSFWRLIEALGKAGRAPRLVAIENVVGLLRSRQGRDFAALAGAIARCGYRLGAIVIDAAAFVPQSRPRLFIVAARGDLAIPRTLTRITPDARWTTRALTRAHARLDAHAARRWLWWTPPAPGASPPPLAAMIDRDASRGDWNPPEATARLLDLMSARNRAKVAAAAHASLSATDSIVGTLYRRTRVDETGARRQRAEARFDRLAGCIRTPAGGSSRQTVIVIERGEIRTRLLSAREAARLMGLAETFILPARYNDAYHAAGDGVVVPVVRHLAQHLFEPLLASNDRVMQTPPALPGEQSSPAREAAPRAE